MPITLLLTNTEAIQLGALIMNAFGIMLIVYQLRQGRKLKQSDNFLHLAQQYVELRGKLRSILLSLDHRFDPTLTSDQIAERMTIEEAGSYRLELMDICAQLISLYRIEYDLWKFGSISSHHWRTWDERFKVEGKTKLWRSAWKISRPRYQYASSFQRFMDKRFGEKSYSVLRSSPPSVAEPASLAGISEGGLP
jgi:hypothetical protein